MEKKQKDEVAELRSHSDVAPKGAHPRDGLPLTESTPPLSRRELKDGQDPDERAELGAWLDPIIPRAPRTVEFRELVPQSGPRSMPPTLRSALLDFAPLAPSTPPRVFAQVNISSPPRTQGALHPLDELLLDSLHQAFSQHAGPSEQLSEEKLQAVLGLKNRLLAQRLLKVFDKDGDGNVSRVEFLERVRRLMYGSTTDKLLFAFRLHDLNADGKLERAEVLAMIRTSMAEENTLHLSQSPEELADLLMQSVDDNADGYLSFREFETALTKHPEVLEMMTRCEACWIAPGVDLRRRNRVSERLFFRLQRVLQNRRAAVFVLSVWVAVNLVLGARALIAYKQAGANEYIMIARAAGACLNFNGALILLPVMRRLLTWVRSSSFWGKLPVDDAIAFHRLVGHTMFGLALVHTGAHLMNYASSGPGMLHSVLRTSAGLSGVLLMAVFVAMVTASLSLVRRSSHFEVFYFSHLLYFAWFALCLYHGPVFYLWATVPLLGFGLEQMMRLSKRGLVTRITEMVPLSSGVTRLTIDRPRSFDFKAGDYAFLRVPQLASHEWHPFTLSSAPERGSELTMHVRSLGDFTRSLRKLAEERKGSEPDAPLEAYLDGPYGTASGHIFESEVAVLVGAGIGVTPFASVLESLLLRARAHQRCPKKVHFYWLNRDAYSFEWFAKLLLELESLDVDHLVDVRIYMTDGRGHGTSAALNLARAISHERGNPDLITGLRSKTNLGRPDWSEELARVATQHAGEAIDIFFCGPPGLGVSIQKTAAELGMNFHQEHF